MWEDRTSCGKSFVCNFLFKVTMIMMMLFIYYDEVAMSTMTMTTMMEMMIRVRMKAIWVIMILITSEWHNLGAECCWWSFIFRVLTATRVPGGTTKTQSSGTDHVCLCVTPKWRCNVKVTSQNVKMWKRETSYTDEKYNKDPIKWLWPCRLLLMIAPAFVWK